MDSHTLSLLEFHDVCNQLRHFAACSLGEEEIARLRPETDLRRIQILLREVSECRRMIDSRGHLPMGGIHDIRSYLEKASVAGLLQPSELLDIHSTILGARQLREFVVKSGDEAPLLVDLAKTIAAFPKLEAEIDRCITPRGEVADNATASLQTVRGRLRVTHHRMVEKLNSIIKSAQMRPLLQDPVVTVRNGRYCIPVKAESRREFGGLVHDSSSSGATVFMEPQAVVELGNEIRELELKEQQEIEKILRTLAGFVESQIGALEATVRTVARFDLIAAKARWANETDSIEPELNTHGYLRLVQARHPLLPGHVVPIDVELGGEFNVLLITGPNTGGKTVTLKTVGLLTLMTQAGLPIPVSEGSRIAVFRKVFADIGDEQSIQQSLSTFSSHIRRIIHILEQVDSETLVLLDELGAGTDPAEGAALAKSIIHHLMDTKARLMATTHYGELKEFALVTPGCKNASVDFDEETLKPTFRLRIGVPGSSNAITIASRLGMPDEVIEKAREMFHPDRAALEVVYREMESDRREADRAATEARTQRNEAERLRKQHLDEYERFQRRRDREIENAALKAREIVRRARQEAEQILSDLRKEERENKTTETARLRLNRLEGRLERASRRKPSPVPEAMTTPIRTDAVAAGDPEPGEEVLLAQFGNQRGILLRRENGSAEVQVGAMRLTVPTRNIQRLREEERTPPKPASGGGFGAVSLQRALEMTDEIDIRGQRADEALLNVEKYLDDARIAGMKKVRILHGKGYGALRKIVRETAKGDSTVAAVTEAPPEEGGAGVTIIELK